MSLTREYLSKISRGACSSLGRAGLCTGGQEFNRARRVVVRSRTTAHERSQVHDGDTVGDCEDVGQVVRDNEHRNAARSQGLDECENLRRLGYPERRGGLVHDDEFGVAHYCARYGDGLALATRKGSDELTDRLDGGDRKITERRSSV